MSVAAAMTTLDDQRPLLSNYEKLTATTSKNNARIDEQQQQQQAFKNSNILHAGSSGPASPPPPTTLTQTKLDEQRQKHDKQVHFNIQQQKDPQQQQHTHKHQQTLSSTTSSSSTACEETSQCASSLSSTATNLAATLEQQQQRNTLLEAEVNSLKHELSRLNQLLSDSQRREKILVRRLANKEQEFQDYVAQIAEYKAAQVPTAQALRTALLDPAVNILFDKLKNELKATKAKLEETQNELSAWKFTPDSNTGKRLMAKCRLLYQENEELGKMTSSGRLAKLETELAMQKSFTEEVKKSQSELDDFLQELDEDVEGMQSTILFLQQELKVERERAEALEKENYKLKHMGQSNEGTNDAFSDATSSDMLDKPAAPTAGAAAAATIQQHGGGQCMPHMMLNGDIKMEPDDELKDIKPYISNICNSSSNSSNISQQHQFARNVIIANALNLKTSPLQTIDENECLRLGPPAYVTPTTTPTHTSGADSSSGGGGEHYNGMIESCVQGGGTPTTPTNLQPINLMPMTPTALGGGGVVMVGTTGGAGGLEECNSNSSSNSINGRPRQTPPQLPARKRNYDSCDSNETENTLNAATLVSVSMTTTSTAAAAAIVPAPPTMIQRQMSATITLPPKKSLRMTPQRRASAQSIDMNDMNDGYNQAQNLSIINLNNNCNNMTAQDLSTTAATMMNTMIDMVVANEENMSSTTTTNAYGEDVVSVPVSEASVAQRIMTRRRSLRSQANGGGGNSGAGGVGVDH